MARLLFVPVSGAIGSGEYYRCLNLARAMDRRRPGLDIHFLLNRSAEVEQEAGFTYHQLDNTPSLTTEPVRRLIEALQPDLAVFDCTGRVLHFRAVRAGGGRVAWISNRPRKRRRGFNPRILPSLDLHLIGEPRRSHQYLAWHERAALRLFGATSIDFFSIIAPEPEPAGVTPRTDLPADYAVFASGGGGYSHQGRPVPELFVEAARRFQAATGVAAVVVMGPQYRGPLVSDGEVRIIPTLPTRALGHVLAGARLGVLGGGFMLTSQALAVGLPTVLAAVGGNDQPRRVQRFHDMGIALAATLDPDALSAQAGSLASDARLGRAMIERARAAGLTNDVAQCAERLLGLLDS